MAEAKIFPMTTFVSCLRDGDMADQSLLDMLSFITQVDVDMDFAPVACSLAKAWIYEQEPKLVKATLGEVTALGQKVSLLPLPENDVIKAQGVLAKMTELKADNVELNADKAALTAVIETLKTELVSVKEKLKNFEDQAAQGDVRLSISSKKMDEHIKKLETLMAEVDKIKKQGVVVSGGAGGNVLAASGEAAGAPPTGGEPSSDFGLGSNPFADANW